MQKVERVEETNQLLGIDFIYVINLKERKNRWVRMKSLLVKACLKRTRFEAVNGWNASKNKRLKKAMLFGPLSKTTPQSHLTC